MPTVFCRHFFVGDKMKKRQIINIVNFIRAVEPREKVDLMKPVTEQIRLMKKHNLRGTFLLQYDALIMPEYSELLKELNSEQFEIGVWHEIVQPMAEKVGIEWRGRFPWDWHAHCGFSVGYTKEEREKLIDVLFEDFKEIMGYYPRVFGSWFFDSHTVRYAYDKYGLDAVCNCKDQYGTDGYTLWGGYYGQGYYPSINNVFMPAQTAENQLDVPLFRMLGSDQVYQFDSGINVNSSEQKNQGVISLEPVYEVAGGGLPEWVDWYMKENFNGECLTFGYAQAGQENSFGWDSMKDGLEYQFPLFERLQKEGRIEVEPLGDTGRWYKEKYKITPASAITAHTAYDDENKNSVWYSSRFYRINLYGDNGKLRIRDLHIFNENFPDPYENEVCIRNEAYYETLPVADGNRFSGNGVLAGIYFDSDNAKHDEMVFEEIDENTALITYGNVKITLSENNIKIESDKDFTLENRIGKDGGHLPQVKNVNEKEIKLSYNSSDYCVKLLDGVFVDNKTIRSEKCRIEAEFSV